MKTSSIITMLAALGALAAGLFSSALRAAEPNKELNLFAWSEYIPQSVIDDFTKETGIKVNYETFASGEEMLQKVITGGTKYDVIQPCDYIAEGMIKARPALVQPIDYSKLPNFANISPDFLGLAYDPQQKYTIPFMVSTVGIVYNTDKIKDDIKGYKDIFQPKYKGRIVTVDDGREMVSWALNCLGLDINAINRVNVRKARALMAGWVKLIKVYDSDSPKTSLLNGDVDIGVVWGGEAARLWREDKKFKYVLPSEGAHMFVDMWAIPVNARNVEAAHKFLDYIMRAEVAAVISRAFPYLNPNLAAQKLLSKEDLENPASYPKIDIKSLGIFRDVPGSGDLTDQVYTDLKNSSGY
ncbi:MAG: spermidine/putrescine ABC transporter substrate-binding protein [Opitutaceae bacterium]|jgi:spermidine/putrescine transport system substrate-binding protein|nr:spermidine/putrescine ABC transporter substrate-binding protein [Opitutaceae bacterium]